MVTETNDGKNEDELGGGMDDLINSIIPPEDEESPTEPAPTEPVLTERDHLEARARELGVVFRSNISDATLAERVEVAKMRLGAPSEIEVPTGAPRAGIPAEILELPAQTRIEAEAGREYLAKRGGI